MRKLQFHFYVCLICKNFDWKHHFCIFTFIFTNYPDCINRWTNILHLYFLSPKRDDWFGYNIVKQTNEIFWVQYSRFVHMTFNQSLRGWSFRSGALDRACHGRSLCLFFRSFFLHFYKSATYCIFFLVCTNKFNSIYFLKITFWIFELFQYAAIAIFPSVYLLLLFVL